MHNRKRICRFLNSREMGGIHIINDKIYACTPRNVPLSEEFTDFSEINADELQKARLDLYNKINDGNFTGCDGCKMLHEADESEVEIGKLQSVILHPYNTCNLRCNYCVLSEEKLSEKLEEQKAHILPIIQNLKNQNLLKESYSLGVGGGEPMMCKDLDKVIEFMGEDNIPKSFVLISNSSVTSKCDYVINSLKKSPCVTKTLHTSIDAGTRETYKKLKSRDLFNQTCENILKYAQNGTFDDITLKYVFTNDETNTSDDDITGFANFVIQAAQLNPKATTVIIDADMKIQRKDTDDYFDNESEFSYVSLSQKQIESAGKMYCLLSVCNSIAVKFIGGRINAERSIKAKDDIEKIKAFAADYAAKLSEKETIKI